MKMRKILPLLGILILFAAALGFGGFYFNKYQNLKKNSPDQISKSIIEKVGRLMELPKDETPSVATVEDKEKLKDQPFFADAVKGDRLLIYQSAKKAIIYRETANRVINVGPIAIQQNQSVAKVAIKVIGKPTDRDAVEKALTAKFADKVTIVKADAKANYTSTTVVDNSTGAQADNVKAIVSTLKNAKSGDLPSTEEKTATTDFNIIIVAGPQQ